MQDMLLTKPTVCREPSVRACATQAGYSCLRFPAVILLLAAALAAAQEADFSVAADSSVVTDSSAEMTMAICTTATLTLQSVPPGANVSLNGTDCGLTPYIDSLLLPGAYTIVLRKPWYDSVTQTIVLKPAANLVMEIPLKSRRSSLCVRSAPLGAIVTLDSQVVGVTPYTNDTLYPGLHRLWLKRVGCLPSAVQEFTLQDASHDTAYVTLTSQVSIDSVKQVRHRRIQWIRRIGFGALGSVAGIAGLVMNGRVSDEVVLEESARNSYMRQGLTPRDYTAAWHIYEDQVSATDAAREKRNALYVLSLLLFAGCAISIPF